MDAIEDGRSLGMAALLVVSALAGFLTAASVTGAEYATVGTVSGDNQAYAVPVAEDTDRLRFVLDAGEDPAPAQAQFSVYDPEDAFFGQFELAGADASVEAITEAQGSWVVFVTKAQNAELQIQRPGVDANATTQVDQITVVEERTEIARQDGDKLRERVALEIGHRPAAISLDYEGAIDALDATVATNEGTAYTLENAQANTTDNGTEESAELASLEPANLVRGLYRVQATAETFDGHLDLVRHDYARNSDDGLSNASKRAKIDAVRNGSVVGLVEDDSARAFDTLNVDNVLFWVEPDAHAHAYLYDANDRFVDEVSLGSHDAECDAYSCQGHGTDSNSSRIAQFVQIEEPGEHVAYVASHSGEGDGVWIGLPHVDDAPKGTLLPVQAKQVSFEVQGFGQAHAAETVNLTGALVETHVDTDQSTSSERNVTVTTELGTAFIYEQGPIASGAEPSPDRHVRLDNYTDGEVTVDLDQNWSSTSETTVELVHYQR